MQKTLYIPIDTTLNYEFECPLLVKKYDTLKFKFAIFSLGILQDLNGQTVDIILHKKDGTTIQKTITDITLNIATIVLDKNASAYVGEVLGEIVITDTGGQATSNIFKFNVSNSLTEDIEIKSKDDIVTIEDMRALIATYKNEISAIGESTQATEALNNITTYIDTNLSELTSKNATAVKNVTDLKKENDRADTNIPGLTNLNDTAEEKLEEFRLYDTAELNKRVQENTSQLNDLANERGYLNTKLISGEDLNTIIKSGIYSGNNLINSPQNNVWYTLEVFNCSNDDYVIQRIMGFADGGITTFERRKNLTKWTDWQRLATTDNPQEFNVTTKNGFTLATGSKASYFKTQDNIVKLNIFLNNSGKVGTNMVMFSLPQGYRNTYTIRARGYINQYTPCEIIINTNGDVWVNGIQGGIPDYNNVQFSESYLADS